MRFATRTREIPKNLARVFSNIAHSSLKMIKSWGGRGERRKNIASKKGIFRLGTKDRKDRRVVFERRIFSFLFCFFFLGEGGGKDFVLVSNYYIR